MSKKFNIHEWQAKQAKKRLTENDDAYQKRQDDMTPGKNPDYFYDDDFKKLKQKYTGASQESMSNNDIEFLQNLVQKYSLDKILVTLGIVGDRALPTRGEDINESLNPEVSRSLDKFIRAMADRYDYTMQDAVYAIMAALKQRNYDGLEEKKGVPHYTKDGKEWKGATHKMPNGKLMTQDPHNKDSEELFHKEDLDEMSTTGGGASFNAGSGEGYMTPNAFKKKKKK